MACPQRVSLSVLDCEMGCHPPPTVVSQGNAIVPFFKYTLVVVGRY